MAATTATSFGSSFAGLPDLKILIWATACQISISMPLTTGFSLLTHNSAALLGQGSYATSKRTPPGVQVETSVEVKNLYQYQDASWQLSLSGQHYQRIVKADRVFVGAGGGALALLQKSGIKEAKGFGGFPISGEFLRTDNPAIVAEYRAGKQKAFNSLVGQIMKAAKGKANPQQVNDLLKAKLDS